MPTLPKKRDEIFPDLAVAKAAYEEKDAALRKKKADKPKKQEWTYGALADDEDLVNILYYGDAGTGKTTAMAHLAKLGPVVYIEAESGLKKAPLQRMGVPIENLRLVRDGIEPQITYRKLEALWERLRIQLDEDENAVVGVIFDSVTEIQKKLLRQTVLKRLKKAIDNGMDVDVHQTYMEDYGTNTEEMRDIVRMYRDLPCHVGFAGLEVRDQDDDGVATYRPALTPKLASDVTGYVDLVCYCQDRLLGGKHWYVGTFKRGNKFMAKDRFGLLPDSLRNPTYDRVVAYINGELTEEDDEQQEEWKAAKAKKSA